MANTQINITENGTKTLLTAGKYCDRNIDVNVAVPGKATQFTNLYDPANVVLKKNSNYSSSSGQVIQTDNYVNYVIIPYDHKAGEPVAIRVRGISIPVRDRNGFVMYNERESNVVTWGSFNSATTKTVDEYGDVVMTFTDSSAFVKNAWKFLHLNFQYIGENGGVTEAKTGPIITINEPIGNGGHAG